MNYTDEDIVVERLKGIDIEVLYLPLSEYKLSIYSSPGVEGVYFKDGKLRRYWKCHVVDQDVFRIVDKGIQQE